MIDGSDVEQSGRDGMVDGSHDAVTSHLVNGFLTSGSGQTSASLSSPQPQNVHDCFAAGNSSVTATDRISLGRRPDMPGWFRMPSENGRVRVEFAVCL